MATEFAFTFFGPYPNLIGQLCRKSKSKMRDNRIADYKHNSCLDSYCVCGMYIYAYYNIPSPVLASFVSRVSRELYLCAVQICCV